MNSKPRLHNILFRTISKELLKTNNNQNISHIFSNGIKIKMLLPILNINARKNFAGNRIFNWLLLEQVLMTRKSYFNQ